MGLFGKKKASVKIGNDRELINENTKSFDALIILAEGNEVLVQQLKEIQEKIKYLIPSDDDMIAYFDKKIKKLIDEARSALARADGETSRRVENALTQIKLTISDRNAKL